MHNAYLMIKIKKLELYAVCFLMIFVNNTTFGNCINNGEIWNFLGMVDQELNCLSGDIIRGYRAGQFSEEESMQMYQKMLILGVWNIKNGYDDFLMHHMKGKRRDIEIIQISGEIIDQQVRVLDYFEENKERLALCFKMESKMAFQVLMELLDEALKICKIDTSSDGL